MSENEEFLPNMTISNSDSNRFSSKTTRSTQTKSLSNQFTEPSTLIRTSRSDDLLIISMLVIALLSYCLVIIISFAHSFLK